MKAGILNRPTPKKNTRLPDFLLVGAAKSATSSLHSYLDQHPQIAMSSQKESWFFSFHKKPPHYSSPGVLNDVVSELDEYLSLYDGAAANQLLGDACPSYLYTYEDTIRNIRQLYSEQALAKLKIIISLREPVSRAFSQYYTFRRKVEEPLIFELAVQEDTINRRLQENWNIFYDYLGFGMYSKQVEAFQQAFGKEQVLVLLFEDIHADIEKTCQTIYGFLGVDADYIVDGSLHHNSISGEPRLKWLVAGLFSRNRFKRMLASLIPKKIRHVILFMIFKPLLKRQVLDLDTGKQVSEKFNKDILLLEELIGRDLSSWRN
jgi:hypothetical protein